MTTINEFFPSRDEREFFKNERWETFKEINEVERKKDRLFP